MRAARQHAGISQADLGRLLGLTQSAVSLLESGERKTGPKLLVELVRVLNRPLSYFVGGDPDAIVLHRSSELAALVVDLEQHPEDLAEVRFYAGFLRARTAADESGPARRRTRDRSAVPGSETDG
jgi:transcriptional regulator with XRE-family HTH domain